MIKTKSALSDNQMVVRAIKDSFVKLSPKVQAENPVMLLVYISAILTSLLWVASLSGVQDVSSGYTLAIAIILWLTCIFANFAEAIAEGRGKAQADALRAAKKDVEAYKLHDANNKENDYLSEINSTQIQIKYDEYNKSYKIRNALIATYAAIWIYSQIDILFFSNQLGSENISAHISDNLQLTNQNKITLSFKFTL